MDEYIKKSDVIEMLAARFNHYTDFINDGTRIKNEIKAIVDRTKKIPAADVAPIVRGHYIIDEDGTPSCSVCGARYIDSTQNYCPSCGARMDEPDVYEM